jgi:DNA-binding transcriptional regulator GbsR (MarR family)
MKNKAYWISPKGEIIPVEGANKHIDIICDQPELFGLKIMKELFEKGWIRVRYVKRSDVFTVESNIFSEKKMINIIKWAKKITNGEIDNISENTNIRFLNSKSEERILSIENLLRG